MDWKTLLAIVLMMVVYFFTFPPSAPTPPKKTTTEQAATPQSVSAGVETSNSRAADIVAPKAAEVSVSRAATWQKDVREIQNGNLILKMNALGEISGVFFKKFPKEPGSEELVSKSFEKALRFNVSRLKVGATEFAWTDQSWLVDGIQLHHRTPEYEVTRTVKLVPDSYIIKTIDTVSNRGSSSAEVAVSVGLAQEVIPHHDAGFFTRIFKPQAEFQKVIWFQEESLDYEMFESFQQRRLETVDALTWTGFADKYFFYGFVPNNLSFKDFGMTNVEGIAKQSLDLLPAQVPPGESTSLEYSYYLGPKNIPDLEKLAPSLSRAIEYGNWIGPIARLLLNILNFFYGIVKNYGIAIFLLTLVVKGILFPLAYKAAVSMRKLSLVQPKMVEIREKYKKDPQRMNVEMMNLYKTEKVNPIGGCLPMLLQMPVFFALYRVFFASIEMRHAPLFGWINDLAHYDPYFVLPVSMTALMVIQQKLTPMPETGQDSEAIRIQRAMFKWMPVVFGAIMLFLPAGLTLYFLVNATLSIVQQLFINKRLDKLYPKKTVPSLQVVNGG